MGLCARRISIVWTPQAFRIIVYVLVAFIHFLRAAKFLRLPALALGINENVFDLVDDSLCIVACRVGTLPRDVGNEVLPPEYLITDDAQIRALAVVNRNPNTTVLAQKLA